MGEKIRILMVEDVEADAELTRRELEKASLSCEIHRVDTPSAYEKALREFNPHVILSDYSLPAFDGASALAIAKQKAPDVPFIFVSGSIGELKAIDALKNGAWDYVLKDHLIQISPAIQRALREVKERARAGQLEDQLRHAQKMEVLGRLAGGVAHDFNNLLTAISGYSELLLGSLAADDLNRADVEEIKKTVYRAAALTRQLLVFSRKQSIKPVVLDINAVLSNLEKMLQRLIGEDISLKTSLDAGIGRVLADPGQIEQVVMNLVINSRDAMPQGGRITIETKSAELDEYYVANHLDVQPGKYVSIFVSDDGCGMTRDVISKIFDPFFTTKEKGTGLGLSTVYGIVKQFGGHIDVYSEPGHGTVFKIYFPPVQGALEGEGIAPMPIESLKGSEVVLLVDDEDSVRKLSRRVLEANGYSVLEARDGQEALRLCESHRGALHLLVTDLVMFGLTGYELAGSVTRLYPQVKVLYLSGYTDEMVKGRIPAGEKLFFLQKPFAPSDLLRKVRETLSS